MVFYKSKVVPYLITSIRHGADPGFLALSLQVTLVIHPAVGCRSVASYTDFLPSWADLDAVPQGKHDFPRVVDFGLLFGKSADFWANLYTALNFFA